MKLSCSDILKTRTSAGMYGAFFLSKFNLAFVFITDIRFSSSTFVLFMLDVRSFMSKFVSSLTFVFQVQHLFFEYRIRFSS